MNEPNPLCLDTQSHVTLNTSDPFFMMFQIVDTLQEVGLASNSESHVDLIESLNKRQEKALILITHIMQTKPEGISLTEFAKRMNITVPAASVLIDGMVQMGFISRIQNPRDRRAICIKLSELGAQIFNNCCNRIYERTCTLTEGLSDSEKDTFTHVIKHIYSNLNRKQK